MTLNFVINIDYYDERSNLMMILIMKLHYLKYFSRIDFLVNSVPRSFFYRHST